MRLGRQVNRWWGRVLADLQAFSPRLLRVLRFGCSPLGVGYLFLVFVLFLACGRAQSLSPHQAETYEKLVALASERDLQVLRARADLEVLRQSALFGAVTADLSFSLAGGFDQLNPGYRLSLGLDLAELLRDKAPAFRSVEAALESAKAALRLRVLEAHTLLLYRLEAAGVASDALEARRAELAAAQARARVGLVTVGEVLGVAERVSQARLALYRANLDLALAQQGLAAVCNVPLETLRPLLR